MHRRGAPGTKPFIVKSSLKPPQLTFGVQIYLSGISFPPPARVIDFPRFIRRIASRAAPVALGVTLFDQHFVGRVFQHLA